jgi:hypothetical protein
MKWWDDYEVWLENKSGFVKILIGLVTVPLMLLILCTIVVMLKAGWDFLWGIVDSLFK